MAAALGAVMDNHQDHLALLKQVTPDDVSKAAKLVEGGLVEVKCQEADDPLYFKAEVQAGTDRASVTVANEYANVIEITRNDDVLYSNPVMTADVAHDQVLELLNNHGLKAMLELCQTMTPEELEPLLAAALTNQKAALAGLENQEMNYGSSLLDYYQTFTPPYTVVNKAQAMTAAASEARMLGLVVPIIMIGGSGNHGITNFLGVLTVAEELGLDRAATARALAVASLITVCTKSIIKRMTAFCGCAVAAATGVAAATVHMLGGDYREQEMAMQSLIGTLGGMFCDGAKESCAYKLSTAVAMAVQFAYLARKGVGLNGGMGILGDTVEETFQNLGVLNNPGMVETEKTIFSIMEKRLSRLNPDAGKPHG